MLCSNIVKLLQHFVGMTPILHTLYVVIVLMKFWKKYKEQKQHFANNNKKLILFIEIINTKLEGAGPI